MGWTTPKTNWVNNEYFNITPDYDRIKGNLDYLHELAEGMYWGIGYVSLPKFTTSDYPTESFFNDIVNATQALIDNFVKPAGVQAMRSYTGNGRAWNADDLNAIEGNHLLLYQALQAGSAMKTVSYGVRHVVNGVEQTSLSRTYTAEVRVIAADVIEVQRGSLAQQNFVGYEYSGISPSVSEGSTVPNGTVITLTYTVDETQTQQTQYTVVHRLEGVIRSSETHYDTVWVNEPNPMIAIQDGTLNSLTSLTGYKVGSLSPEVNAGDKVASGTCIYLDYVSDSAQTKTVRYTVRHSVNGSIQSAYTSVYTKAVWINDPDVIEIYAGSLGQKTFEGYKHSSVSPSVAEGDEVTSGTVITLYYVKDSAQTKEIGYTYQIAFDGAVNSTYTRRYTETVWINDPDAVTVQWTVYDNSPEYAGCTLESVSHDVRVGDTVPSGTVITAYYITEQVDHAADLKENGFGSSTYANALAMGDLRMESANWEDPDLAYYLAVWSAKNHKSVNLGLGEIIHVPHKVFGNIPFMLAGNTHTDDYDGETGMGISMIARDIVVGLAFDAKSELYPTGSSMYANSNLFRWLNSTAAQNWFTAAEEGDMPPTAEYVTQNPYAAAAGFLNGFDAEFLDVLLPVSKPYVFQGQTTYAPAAKVFVPSVDELFGGSYTLDYEGEMYEIFMENTDLRVAYDLRGGNYPWMYWTRTASDSGSLVVIDENGDTSDGCSAYTGAIGVRPGIVLNGF